MISLPICRIETRRAIVPTDIATPLLSSSAMTAIERAIQAAGGQTALGRLIGKDQRHVYMWKKRGKVPAEVCADIEAATNGAVTCHELRPDVFRAPAKKGRAA